MRTILSQLADAAAVLQPDLILWRLRRADWRRENGGVWHLAGDLPPVNNGARTEKDISPSLGQVYRRYSG
jgi:hypothetical protein